MNIFITGANGFVGKNFISFFKNKYQFNIYKKLSKIDINENIVVHFAGKAHDTKNYLKPNEYYKSNTELTKKIFDSFLSSKAQVFIMLSSVKAVADSTEKILTENTIPNPKTHYGISKLLAEKYIFSKKNFYNKRVYILRPCMIHGPGNKGNLNILYKFVSKGIPWPLGSYDNYRSYCSIDNLLFIMNELIENKSIPSGIYNVSDEEPLSTNKIISLMSINLKNKKSIWMIPKVFIKTLAFIGDIIPIPLNSERLKKLTESYVVSNSKILKLIEKKLPLSSEEGMIKTLKSFK